MCVLLSGGMHGMNVAGYIGLEPQHYSVITHILASRVNIARLPVGDVDVVNEECLALKKGDGAERVQRVIGAGT